MIKFVPELPLQYDVEFKTPFGRITSELYLYQPRGEEVVLPEDEERYEKVVKEEEGNNRKQGKIREEKREREKAEETMKKGNEAIGLRNVF